MTIPIIVPETPLAAAFARLEAHEKLRHERHTTAAQRREARKSHESIADTNAKKGYGNTVEKTVYVTKEARTKASRAVHQMRSPSGAKSDAQDGQ